MPCVLISYYSAMHTVMKLTNTRFNRPAMCGYSCYDWTIIFQEMILENGQFYYFCNLQIWHPILECEILFNIMWMSDHSCWQTRRLCISLWKKRTDEKMSLNNFHSYCFHLLQSFHLCRDGKKRDKEASKGNTSSEWTFVDWLHPLLFILSSLINS